MTFYAMRPKFNKLSIKIGLIFSKLPFTPNQWTFIGILPALAAAWLLTQQAWLLAGALFFISASIDLIDGSVARVTGRTTLFGAYLDTIVDRYVETIIIAALFFAGLPAVFSIAAAFWIFFYYFGSIMSTYVKAAAKEKGYVDEEIKGGIVERAEKLLILFAGILAAYFNPIYLVYVLIGLGVLANITALQRIAIARRLGKNR